MSWLLLAMLLAWPAWLLRQRWRWPWRGCLTLAIVSVAMMTPLAADTLLAWLEHPQPVATDCATRAPDTVVVLGGGFGVHPHFPGDFSALNLESRRRADAGIQYWREDRARVLVLVGGPPHPGAPPEASVLAAYARWQGVAEASLRLETRSMSTWENARFVAAMPIPRRVALATSAMHMRRARYAFDSAGMQTCPVTADSRRVPLEMPFALLPRSSALEKAEDALHEIVGLAYYHWLHWSGRTRHPASG